MKFSKNKIKFIVLIIITAIIISILIPKIPYSKDVVDTKSNTESLDSLGKASVQYSNNSTDLYVSDKLKNKPIPTNRIWSSVTFTGNLLGLYNYPIVSKTINNILAIGAPKKNATNDVVTAQLGGEYFSVSSDSNVDKVYVEDYSDLTVRLSFKDYSKQELFQAVFIQGSPYVYIFPKKNTLNISNGVYSMSNKSDVNVLTYNNKSFGVFSNGTSSITSNGMQLRFDNLDNAYLTLGLFTDDKSFASIRANSQNFIDKIYATFDDSKDNVITTHYNVSYLKNSKNENTVFGFLPHQYTFGAVNKLFEIDTLRGLQDFTNISNNFDIITPRAAMLEDIPYVAQDSTRKDQIIKFLQNDVKNINTDVDTSYYGGKNVAKIATLLEIANNVNDEVSKQTLITTLKSTLSDWYTYSQEEKGKYFTYDRYLGGLIASIPEFDSSKYNDHHFHYGYYIYASAILAKYDNSFTQDYKEFVKSIVSDIANNNRDSKYFPYLRSFDIYEGHSWASGIQPFEDGNNQESTSEAINAWYGIWLWGKNSGDNNLMSLGSSLYSLEINSANFYWLNRSNNKSIFPVGYQHNTASIVWGGKSEYNTFFSTNPLAIEGIQYLPFTAGSIYLYNPQAIVRDKISAKKYLDAQRGDWVDVNYMYYGMLDGLNAASLDTLKTIPIDNGNSLTNVYNWLSYWNEMKNAQITGGKVYTLVTFYQTAKSVKIMLNCFNDTSINTILLKTYTTLTCKKGISFKTATLTDNNKLIITDLLKT